MRTSPEFALAEKRFGGLFKAARVLLGQARIGEEIIIPTLAFAWVLDTGHPQAVRTNERLKSIWGTEGLRSLEEVDFDAWRAEGAQLTAEYGALRPLCFYDGVLLLFRESVLTLVNQNPEANASHYAVVEVYQNAKTPPPEAVAEKYERVISRQGFSLREDCGLASIGHLFANGCLNMFVAPVERPLAFFLDPEISDAAELDELEREAPTFPPALWVRRYYEALLETPEGKKFRGRPGPALAADNLVLACVACLLYFGIASRKEIQRLLNKYVLCGTGKTLPEVGTSFSETNQLWRNAEKVMGTLFTATDSLLGDPPVYRAYNNWPQASLRVASESRNRYSRRTHL